MMKDGNQESLRFERSFFTQSIAKLPDNPDLATQKIKKNGSKIACAGKKRPRYERAVIINSFNGYLQAPNFTEADAMGMSNVSAQRTKEDDEIENYGESGRYDGTFKRPGKNQVDIVTFFPNFF